MTTPIQNILHTILRKPDEPLNILCLAFDGQFETLFNNTNHVFHICLKNDAPWYLKLMSQSANLRIYPNIELIPSTIAFDAVICNDRIKQYAEAKTLCRFMHLPLIIVDHYDISSFKKEDIHLIAQNKGDFAVCTSLSFKNLQWIQYNQVIPYGITIPDTIPTKIHDIIVIGDYGPHQPIISSILSKYPNTQIINKEHHPNTYNEMYALIQQSKVFINIPERAMISIPMLQAMANQCVVVTPPHPICQHVLQSNNSMTFTELSTLDRHLNTLLTDDQRRTSLGIHAQQVIKNQFDVETFKTGWQNLFRQTQSFVYKG